MKVETPQILWHNGTDNEQNKNAPIFSISILESGIVASNKFGLVLATAGNHEVNLWKLQIAPDGKEIYSKLDRNTPFRMVKIELLTTLTRHDTTVNVVKFSPNGLHLATASDSGSIIIYSVPPSKRGGGNGKHYWSSIETEHQLSLRIISGHDAIYDLDWSADSRRFVVGTLDHTLAIYEDDMFMTNSSPTDLHKESQWNCVYRNARDHTHYVQGVAMDPQGTYVASMSCDRTVRLYSRKLNKKKKTNSDAKLELGKGKLIKYYIPKQENELASSSTGSPSTSVLTTEAIEKAKRVPLFAEEAASESFFRRLAFTTDGAYLVTPAALWNDKSATLMFRRHNYDTPCKVLPGHDKPSRVVGANPVLFHLPSGVARHAGLPYKSVFCVLTEKSVLIYDTYHSRPISMARGLHYSGLTDATWTPDGQSLVVCSSDGYISFIMFEEGDLGRVYVKKEEIDSVETNHVGQAKRQATTPSVGATSSDVAVVSPLMNRERSEPPIHVLQPKTKSTGSISREVTTRRNALFVPDKQAGCIVDEEPDGTAREAESNCTTLLLSQGAKHGGKLPSVNILQPKKKRKRAELTLISRGPQ